MDKKSNNPENIKKYTFELRELVDNSDLLTPEMVKKLQKKFDLSDDELLKIEVLVDKKIAEAENYYDYGEWNKAIDSIEEASYKAPFNKRILKLYYKIINEKISILGEKPGEESIVKNILNRINLTDRFLYKKLLKERKGKNKVNRALLFLLIPVIIVPIYFILPRKVKTVDNIPKKDILTSRIGKRDIEVKYIPINSRSSIKIELKESLLDGTKDNFLYKLKFFLYSEDENIINVKGDINWLNFNQEVIYKESFSSQKDLEYYIEEKIPVSYSKTSHRLSPDFYSVKIEITDSVTAPGKKRGKLREIKTLNSGSNTLKLSVNEANFIITRGVTSNFLSLTLLLSNNSSDTINFLSGDLEWVDDYNSVVFSRSITLISKDDIPLEPNKRLLKSIIIELDKDITPNYRVNIGEGL